MKEPSKDTKLKEFLTLSLQKCLHFVEAQSGSIFLVDKKKQELVLEVFQNTRGVDLEGLRQKLGEGVSGMVATNKQPLLVKDANTFPRTSTSTFHDYKSKSFLSVPFEYRGDLLGVLNVTDRTKGDSFSSDDLTTVLHVCHYLGIAIYSLKRYLHSQRAANERLRQEIKVLQNDLAGARKFSSLGKMVGGLVHELNNPLDGTIRYINLALECSKDDEVVSDYLLEAKQGVTRMANFVRSLLDFSWGMSSTSSFIEVNRTVDECLFSLGNYIKANQVKIKRDFAAYLPKIADYRLKVVVSNLIKNACDAMNKEGGVLTVVTSLENDCIKIVFSDTGCGIDSDLQKKIFEPFFTTKNMGEGSGLGLAISYEVVERYNGDISVESSLNRGTTFTVTLPIEREDVYPRETLDSR